MEIPTLIYYIGYAFALVICWNLGRIFWIPMLLNIAFDIALTYRLLSGWDSRWMIVGYDLGIFLWVLALAGNVPRMSMVTLLMADLATIIYGMWAPLQLPGDSAALINAASTAIDSVWMTSVVVVVASVILRSSLIAKLRGDFVDVLTNPKKRFLIPLGLWAAVEILPYHFPALFPKWFCDYRYPISAHVLVWGWVAIELPFYIMNKRLMRQVD